MCQQSVLNFGKKQLNVNMHSETTQIKSTMQALASFLDGVRSHFGTPNVQSRIHRNGFFMPPPIMAPSVVTLL